MRKGQDPISSPKRFRRRDLLGRCVSALIGVAGIGVLGLQSQGLMFNLSGHVMGLAAIFFTRVRAADERESEALDYIPCE